LFAIDFVQVLPKSAWQAHRRSKKKTKLNDVFVLALRTDLDIDKIELSYNDDRLIYSLKDGGEITVMYALRENRKIPERHQGSMLFGDVLCCPKS
jgi:hypothetical protein